MDIHDHRLTLIEENATRLGITNIRALLHDGTKPLPGFENRADAVLVDAPCSGLGVLNRRAEARWTKKERTLSQFPPPPEKDPCPGRGLCEARRQAPIQYLYLGTG